MIFSILFRIIGIVITLPVLAYFLMIFYYAQKDDTTYQYQHYRCDEKVFETPMPLKRCQYNDTGVVYIEDNCGDSSYTKQLKVYSQKKRFRFVALYSTYDFEGGTFYKYLIEDEKGDKAFLDYDDIDPLKCSYDINDSYWFKNNRQYLPHEGDNAKKVDYKSLWKLFKK